MSDKTALTPDEIRELKCELARVNAQLFPSQAHIAMELAVTCIEQLERAVLAASEDRRDAEIIAAAKNLVAVKGRFHTEQAYKRLIAAIAAAGNHNQAEQPTNQKQ